MGLESVEFDVLYSLLACVAATRKGKGRRIRCFQLTKLRIINRVLKK